MGKRRLDVLLTEKGLAESYNKAQALIMAGDVLVNGKPVDKAGTLVDEDAAITVAEPPPFVSRGGLKLDHALTVLQVDAAGKVAADIGASTGGFTDALLKRGASRVYAVDVGRGQLDYRLRRDPRVVVKEEINARYPIDLPEKVDLVTIDVSFISVKKIIPSVANLLKPDGCLIVLIKPQFEAERDEVGKGGVIKDPLVHARVLGRFIVWLTGHGFRLRGLISSPIAGTEGNREFFVLLTQE